MKLVCLSIRNLHGCYDYQVNFNEDVTFLFGPNGCGKTTLLNITGSIITGHLFNLFDYKFDSIELKYTVEGVLNEKTINISWRDCDLVVNFNDSEHILRQSNQFDTTLYFKRNIVLRNIADDFKCIYLPSNRNISTYVSNNDVRDTGLYANEASDSLFQSEGASRNTYLSYATTLISKHYTEMNCKIAQINDKFRSNIFKSLLDTDLSLYDISSMGDFLSQRDALDFSKVKNDYLQMLKGLNLISESEETKYNDFFDQFIEGINSSTTVTTNIPSMVSLSLKLNDFLKIQRLLALGEEMKKEMDVAKRPINTFLETVNDFIEQGSDDKRLYIDYAGRVFAQTQYSDTPISVYQLSSGEKQLLVFFANLVFNVQNDSSCIVIIDEPELSLYLSWQKIFVDKALDIRKNIQLICATHSPEVIGRRRDRMRKVDKFHKGNE